jgi:hypothetical protein
MGYNPINYRYIYISDHQSTIVIRVTNQLRDSELWKTTPPPPRRSVGVLFCAKEMAAKEVMP